jgi:hypothetical protein
MGVNGRRTLAAAALAAGLALAAALQPAGGTDEVETAAEPRASAPVPTTTTTEPVIVAPVSEPVVAPEPEPVVVAPAPSAAPAPATPAPVAVAPLQPVAPPAPVSYLYGPQAGYWPRSVTLGVRADVSAPGLAQAVAWWNQTAGRTLFAFGSGPVSVRSNLLPDGTVVCPGMLACSATLRADESFSFPPAYPYGQCNIYVRPDRLSEWTTLAHELAHCLGFDHHPGYDHFGDPAHWREQLVLAGYAS